MKFAKQLISEINSKLPDGYPFIGQNAREKINLLAALDIAKTAKCSSDREKTRTSYLSIYNIFATWAIDKGLSNINIDEFGRGEAFSFLDYAQNERKIGACTYNNYVIMMRALFNELVSREIVEKNPFAKIVEKKATSKGRRSLSEFEKKMILNLAQEKDPDIILPILLLYYTFIRPVELRRLKIHFIDIPQQIIKLPGEVTKNKDNETVTIPLPLADYITNLNLHKLPGQLYLFGAGLKPGLKPCGHHTINRRHSYLLDELKTRGILSSTQGISIYSWKDTGAEDLVRENVNIVEIMKQLRHKNLATTQVYLNSFSLVNHEILKKARKLL